MYENRDGDFEISDRSSENKGREGVLGSVIFCRHLNKSDGFMLQIILVARWRFWMVARRFGVR